MAPYLERKTRFELATSTLARSHSTTESLPQVKYYVQFSLLVFYAITHAKFTKKKIAKVNLGGNNRDRTCDPLLVRQVLSQLSYAPTPVQFSEVKYKTD